MNSLKKILTFALLFVVLFSFIKKDENDSEFKLDLTNIDVIETLSIQKNECRPSSNLMFYVETNLVKKARGSNTICAKVFVLDRVSGLSNLIANENILVPKFKDAISLKHEVIESNCSKISLESGDLIIGSNNNTPYCFSELIQFESIYNSYEKAKNKLLE